MSDYICRKCPYKKLCKEIGIDDLSCEDIANIAKAGEVENNGRPCGKWIVKGNSVICSVCGYNDLYENEQMSCAIAGEGFANFCPNCGCWMKGADDE